MAEVTAFGKLLRKLRIDYSEVLGTMAKRLGISPNLDITSTLS